VNGVEARGQRIFEFLSQRLDQGFTLEEICGELQIHPGDKTRRAMRHARRIATEQGLHLPPATPGGGFRYWVTASPGLAVDGTLQMAAVEAGVRRRKEIGVEFIEATRRDADPADRPIINALLSAETRIRDAVAQMDAVRDDVVKALIASRREQRNQNGQ
jgi:hypothetical protein